MCCNSWGRKESDTTERLIWSECLRYVLKAGAGRQWLHCLTRQRERLCCLGRKEKLKNRTKILPSHTGCDIILLTFN